MIDLSQLEKVKTDKDFKLEEEKANAISYLKSTDWYVIRMIETDTPIPDEVKTLRLQARVKISE